MLVFFSVLFASFCGGVIPSSDQELLLAMDSGITPGAKGIIWDARDQTLVGYKQEPWGKSNRLIVKTVEIICQWGNVFYYN